MRREERGTLSSAAGPWVLVQEPGHLWGPQQDSAPLLFLWLPPVSLLSVSSFPFILACFNLPPDEPRMVETCSPT